MKPDTPPTLIPPPLHEPRSQFPYWIFAVFLALPIFLCGFGSYFAAKQQIAMKRKSDQDIQRTMEAMDHDMQAMQDATPQIGEKPSWRGDVLTVKFTFSSDKTEFKNMTITQLLLDNYLPDKKFPLKVDTFGPKKPYSMVVRFPGFDSRGGKYAKLNLTYELPDGGPDLEMYKVAEDNMPKGVGVVGTPEKGTWSSSVSPGLYIPLRGSVKHSSN